MTMDTTLHDRLARLKDAGDLAAARDLVMWKWHGLLAEAEAVPLPEMPREEPRSVPPRNEGESFASWVDRVHGKGRYISDPEGPHQLRAKTRQRIRDRMGKVLGETLFWPELTLSLLTETAFVKWRPSLILEVMADPASRVEAIAWAWRLPEHAGFFVQNLARLADEHKDRRLLDTAAEMFAGTTQDERACLRALLDGYDWLGDRPAAMRIAEDMLVRLGEPEPFFALLNGRQEKVGDELLAVLMRLPQSADAVGRLRSSGHGEEAARLVARHEERRAANLARRAQ
jgi:hypothetical protein